MRERFNRLGLVGEMAAEFVGTMVLILFGSAVVAQVVAGGALTTPPGGLGDHDSISWAWGIGVTMGVYVAARLSGAHLNPAVTVTLATFKGFPWRKVAPYALAQTAGAFVAALLVRWNYTEALAKADPGHTFKTQTVFSTLPANGNPNLPVHEWGAFRDQVIGTALLLLMILAITDVLNTPPAPTWARSSPVWSSWASVWPGAPTRATPSTPRATSAPGWPVTSPGTAVRGGISTETSTSGCRSSAHWSAVCSAGRCTRASSDSSCPRRSPSPPVVSRPPRADTYAEGGTHG